jgi:hypothetical protein
MTHFADRMDRAYRAEQEDRATPGQWLGLMALGAVMGLALAGLIVGAMLYP